MTVGELDSSDSSWCGKNSTMPNINTASVPPKRKATPMM